jgi:DNA primase
VEISEIVESVDILKYISQFCDLEMKSDGEYWGLSPLKNERTPSFSVNVEKQRFYDFSSGKGGNVLEFIRQYNNCDFYKALKILKEYAQIADDEDVSSNKKLAATSIAKKFRNNSKNVKESRSVILPADYMERYEWNEAKMKVWADEGISWRAMKRFQVRYDPFSNRLVYPIRNLSGEIINVCGRTLDPEWKMKKLRKYTYFKPLGILDTIYGLAENKDAILEQREIILFEGAKSVMIADSWGIKNTAAILTSHLNSYQFRTLIRLRVRIVFALDSDIDIRSDSNIMKLKPYAQVDWVRNFDDLLDEKDSPVDKGLKVFQQLYRERRRLA